MSDIALTNLLSGAAAQFGWISELISQVRAGPKELSSEERRVLDFVNEGIKPIFAARSREDYWRIRDSMFMDGSLWIQRLFDLLKAVPGTAPEKSPFEAFDLSPPRFLSALARERLREGNDWSQRIASQWLDVQKQTGATSEQVKVLLSEVASHAVQLEPRAARILASSNLLMLWAAWLMAGNRPHSDEVAESIAKDYANIMGGLFGLMSFERAAPGGVGEWPSSG